MSCTSVRSYFFRTVCGIFFWFEFLHISQAEENGEGRRLIDENRYKDQEAFDHHSQTESFGNFVRSLKDEEILAKPFELLFGNPAGGFVRI